MDAEAPVFTAFPNDISLTVVSLNETTVASWLSPSATDNATSVVMVEQTTGLSSGSAFPVGITVVTFATTDAAGTVTKQSFNLTVTAVLTGTVTFVVNSEADGTSSISSSEPKLNTSVHVTSGFGSSGIVTLHPGTFSVNFTVPNGIGVEFA